MDLATHLDDPSRKTRYVRTMFDIVAPGYDRFTRAFSFGMDRSWKAALIVEAGKRTRQKATILDLACGTGDLGIALGRLTSAQLVVGADLSSNMLAEARTRAGNEQAFALVACDILFTCLADSSVDVVTVGYGLRNTADPRKALAEIARVLKPGGVLASLDFHRPVSRVWRGLFLWYILHAGRLGGWLWHREPVTYGYIAPSIRRYFSVPEFEEALAEAGFAVEWRAQPLRGAIAIHISRRIA